LNCHSNIVDDTTNFDIDEPMSTSGSEDKRNDDPVSINEDDVLYEEAMKDKYNRSCCDENSSSNSVSQFLSEVKAYEKNYCTNRLSSTCSVLQFWKEHSATFPLLYDIALIVLAAAGTQVTVEQLFSQLKFILNDQRASLSPENVQNILLVRCNFQHLDDVFINKIALNKI